MVTSQSTSIPEVATNVEQNLIQSETMDDDDTTRLGTKRPSSEISIGVPSEPVGKSPLMTVEDNNKSINSEDFLRDLKNTNKSNLNKEKTDLKKNNIPSLNDDSSHRRLIDRDSEHINLESDYDKDDMYALLPFHGEHKRAISCLGEYYLYYCLLFVLMIMINVCISCIKYIDHNHQITVDMILVSLPSI